MQKLKNTLTKQDRHFSTNALVFIGLMVALNYVLSLFTIQVTSQIRISIINFVPAAMAGMLCGPVYGAIVGALGDILNWALRFSKWGPLNPGLTLTAALSGLWYGLVLYKKEKVNWPIAALAIVPVVVLGEMVCNTLWNLLWDSLFKGKAAWADIPMRLVTNVIEIPLKVLILMGITQIIHRIPKRYLKL